MSNPNTAAKPQDSMLFEPPFSPLTALFHKSTYRSLPLTIVTMNANMALILTVYLANIPFSNDKARVAWVASCYFSLAIFGLMIISIIALMILIRAPETPLAPDTIAARLYYLSAGLTIASRFGPFSTLNTGDRDRAITKCDAGLTGYRFGWLAYPSQSSSQSQSRPSQRTRGVNQRHDRMVLGIESTRVLTR